MGLKKISNTIAVGKILTHIITAKVHYFTCRQINQIDSLDGFKLSRMIILDGFKIVVESSVKKSNFLDSCKKRQELLTLTVYNRQVFNYSWQFRTVKIISFNDSLEPSRMWLWMTKTIKNTNIHDILKPSRVHFSWHLITVKKVIVYDILYPSRVFFFMTFWNRQEFRCLWHLRTVKKFIVHDISEPSSNFPYFLL